MKHRGSKIAIAFAYVVAVVTAHAQTSPSAPPVSNLPSLSAQAAALPSSTLLDEQEQRRRAQQQQIERERERRAPNVDLDNRPSEPAVDDGRVPVESPCFKIDEIAVELPPGLSDLARTAGERGLNADPLFPGALLFVASYLEQYRGQCVGREGLNVIVHRVSAVILEHGYTTTRVVIPAQDLSSGTLHFAVIPGVIHAIRFADEATWGTWRNAFPTRAGRLLNLRDLEQGLEQMKRVPNQDVDMQIVPAESTGESDIVITVKREKPWTLAVSLDDSGLKSTGRLQASAHAGFSNLLGLSDILDISYNHDADGHESTYGTHGSAASYSIPWGHWTFTATASAYDYHQQIAGAFANFISSGKAESVDVKAEYLFYRNQVQKNTLEFRTGKYFSEAFLDGSEIDIQHRDNSFAEIGWEHKHYFGAAQFDSTIAYRWGVPWFGAQGDLPGVGSGAPTYYYQIETVDATLSVPFQIGRVPLRYVTTLRAQNSPSVLYPTEYFSIGSRYTVRGFDGDTMLAAEKGAFVRNDLEMPIFQTGQALYLGLDAGEVFGPQAHNLIGRRLAGAVIGLRGSPVKHVNYDVFVGGPLYEPEHFPNRSPVAGFSVSFQL